MPTDNSNDMYHRHSNFEGAVPLWYIEAYEKQQAAEAAKKAEAARLKRLEKKQAAIQSGAQAPTPAEKAARKAEAARIRRLEEKQAAQAIANKEKALNEMFGTPIARRIAALTFPETPMQGKWKN